MKPSVCVLFARHLDRNHGLSTIFGFFVLATTLHGSAITTTSFSAGTVVNVSQLSDSDPISLIGLSAFADFSAGNDLTCTFTVGDTCTASGSNNVFSLSRTGSTFTLNNTATVTRQINSITIDLAAVDAVFDLTNPNPGTVGSGPGLDLSGTASGTAVGSAVFTNAVAVSPNPVQNDVFKFVTIGFTPGLAQLGTATFNVDLDQVVTAIPEPGSAQLLAAAAAAAFLLRRRR